MPREITLTLEEAEGFLCLELPIYTSPKNKTLPLEVKRYVLAREGISFRPHQTTFSLLGEKVVLSQKIPFSKAPLSAPFRKELRSYCLLAKHCRTLLLEMAIEEAFNRPIRSETPFRTS